MYVLNKSVNILNFKINSIILGGSASADVSVLLANFNARKQETK